jgi:hypothetical protein
MTALGLALTVSVLLSVLALVEGLRSWWNRQCSQWARVAACFRRVTQPGKRFLDALRAV